MDKENVAEELSSENCKEILADGRWLVAKALDLQLAKLDQKDRRIIKARGDLALILNGKSLPFRPDPQIVQAMNILERLYY
jgi:hypothetical protein